MQNLPPSPNMFELNNCIATLTTIIKEAHYYRITDRKKIETNLNYYLDKFDSEYNKCLNMHNIFISDVHRTPSEILFLQNIIKSHIDSCYLFIEDDSPFPFLTHQELRYSEETNDILNDPQIIHKEILHIQNVLQFYINKFNSYSDGAAHFSYLTQQAVNYIGKTDNQYEE